VFVLWHLDERPTGEVCQAAKVTPTNLWVMLHRARLRMWRCLSRNWYGVEPDERKGRAEP
jgi:RNA polymerase sigma-70 factor (ECF subfamily)